MEDYGLNDTETKDRLTGPARVWAAFYFLAYCAFAGIAVRANVLPDRILCPMLIGSGVISLLLIWLMCSRRIRKPWKITAIVLSVAMTACGVYVWGHLHQATSFLSKVTKTQHVRTENYYLLTGKNSALKTENDLTDHQVEVFSSEDSGYTKARKTLEKRDSVTFDEGTNLEEMGLKLTTDQEAVMLVNAAHYQALQDQIDGFRKKTRVLKVLKVEMPAKDLSKNVDVTEDSFNIYLSGLDTSGSIRTKSRSDVNMIITVNPKTHQILLTSIPRDCLIRLTEKDNAQDKLTHTGLYGIQQTMESVEDLTGLDMNYYIKVNYSTVKRFIDAIGGIDVYSDQAFSTSGQAYYEFKKGKNHLNGAEALAFARERHAFADGDLQRNRDQEKIMAAILKKASSSRTILGNYSKILASCEDYMEVNLSQKEISELVKMQVDGRYHWKVTRQGIDGEAALQQVYSMGQLNVSVLKPDEKSVQKCAKKIRTFMKAGTKADE